MTVTSVSGGRTSSYMAIHYPTDKYVFAVVKTTDKNAIPKDKGLLREVVDRIPDFVASRELDETLEVVLRLEQEIGTRIDWVSSDMTYDQLIDKHQLPNQRLRICTDYLKLKPLFLYCYNLPSSGGVVSMNIGFRWDEKRRKEKLLGKCDRAYTYKIPISCNIKTKKQEWKNIEYRVPQFPLIDDYIDNKKIISFWMNKEGWNFPKYSNCDFCFFNSVEKLKEQITLYPERFLWWKEQEEKENATWDSRYSYAEVEDSNLSISHTPLFSCQCTD